jgi:hypothetical protein
MPKESYSLINSIKTYQAEKNDKIPWNESKTFKSSTKLNTERDKPGMFINLHEKDSSNKLVGFKNMQ